MSYRNLEKDYYKALHEIVSSTQPGIHLISQEKLPYLLENITSARLKKSRRWIISAISGSGKTTILKQLVSVGFIKLPNVTTRSPRREETEDENIFINKKKFLSWKHQNLLFHPHKRNGVLQALLKKDIKKLMSKSSHFYLDKSVASSLELKNSLPGKVNFTFIYVLTPTFKELYRRISQREMLRKIRGEKYLSKKDIFNRFEEEIHDMKKSIKLPYVYVVNDTLQRVKKILHKSIKSSKLM